MKIPTVEGIRGFAAVYVFLHHLRPLDDGYIEFSLRMGQEAVILFFLVSGFVISYSCFHLRDKLTVTNFLYRRALRIYPIFVASIILSATAALVGNNTQCMNWKSLFGNLFMLQDLGFLKSGTLVEPFCSNTPLWSLSYEWWFYVMFGLVALGLRWKVDNFRPAAGMISVLGIVTFLIFPNQGSLYASYFAIWWAGVELAVEYSATNQLSFARQRHSLTILAICSSIWAIPVLNSVVSGVAISFGREPVLQLRHFLASIAFVVLLLVLYERDVRLSKLVAAGSVFAPFSYGLYASHQPVIDLVRYMNLGHVVTPLVSITAAFAVAYFLELVMQPFVVKLISRRVT